MGTFSHHRLFPKAVSSSPSKVLKQGQSVATETPKLGGWTVSHELQGPGHLYVLDKCAEHPIPHLHQPWH